MGEGRKHQCGNTDRDEGNEGFESRVMIKDSIEKEKKQVALFPAKVSHTQLRDLLA